MCASGGVDSEQMASTEKESLVFRVKATRRMWSVAIAVIVMLLALRLVKPAIRLVSWQGRWAAADLVLLFLAACAVLIVSGLALSELWYAWRSGRKSFSIDEDAIVMSDGRQTVKCVWPEVARLVERPPRSRIDLVDRKGSVLASIPYSTGDLDQLLRILTQRIHWSDALCYRYSRSASGLAIVLQLLCLALAEVAVGVFVLLTGNMGLGLLAGGGILTLAIRDYLARRRVVTVTDEYVEIGRAARARRVPFGQARAVHFAFRRNRSPSTLDVRLHLQNGSIVSVSAGTADVFQVFRAVTGALQRWRERENPSGGRSSECSESEVRAAGRRE